MELYKRIKQRREQLGISQDELASKLGYKSRSSIYKIEIGENDIPQSKIQAFADALYTTPTYLLGYDSANTEAAYFHLNNEAIEMAREISENKDLRTLFKVLNNANSVHLKAYLDMIVRLEQLEHGGEQGCCSEPTP